ncbi:hypothetical protein SO802_010837 [Lithocarpus litseifolius]|uniref:Endonuclease/exonuclease/phosphatase domain-containing protein n=1 Tax=Lithocarpus litseifolius TaxID=425828 RepID=A0AAW2DJ42_9ROSI
MPLSSISLLAWNYQGLGSPSAVRTLTDEVKVKNLILVFLSETKASLSKMKGFQNKIEYTEGIIVPSNGKSGGLAMIWKKGAEIRLKSCFNSHIDVMVVGETRQAPWRATRFYGQPDSDLGFVGQRYTWYNGRVGKKRTLIRLDRVVANEARRSMFMDASVHHLAMFALDHCMIALNLKRKNPTRPAKRRQIIKNAWDPLQDDTYFQIHERLRSCQDHLQRWNREVFGNVNKTLRVKQQQVQELGALNVLHETVEEIEGLRKEINEVLIKEEVM